MEPDILLCGRVRTKLSSVLRMQTFKQGNLLYDKHIAVPLGSLHWGRVGIGLGSFIRIVRVSLVRGECAQMSVGLQSIFCSLLFTVVIWLILPEVICLSQRLSHACLSVNNFIL